VKRARVESIPDIELKGGLQQNSKLLANGRVGLQGFAEIGVELHVFDRNRGNVQAARAEVERARQELQRVNLSLRARKLPVSGRSAATASDTSPRLDGRSRRERRMVPW
jgi:cobalt-zinc-cadmium efflux system outer membrane protein